MCHEHRVHPDFLREFVLLKKKKNLSSIVYLAGCLNILILLHEYCYKKDIYEILNILEGGWISLSQDGTVFPRVN